MTKRVGEYEKMRELKKIQCKKFNGRSYGTKNILVNNKMFK